MPGLLLSGPAGAGKSSVADDLVRNADEPTILADFTGLVVCMLAHQRQADGRYPLRPSWVLPLAEYMRRELIDEARRRGIRVVATNSDGNADRRRALLDRIGAPARERIVDPGRDVVRARLSDPATGELSDACRQAIARWYDRG